MRKMDDNEFALRLIVNVLSHYCLKYGKEDSDIYLYNFIFNKDRKPQKGDVAIAQTSGYINCNPFAVGLVEEVIEDGLRIKNFKTGNLCDYTNESFIIIPREKMGFKFMFGKEREIYEALYKEWCGGNPGYKFYKFSFIDNHLRWSIREYFKDDEYAVVEFDTADDMKIRDIVKKAFDLLDIELKKKDKDKYEN